MSEEKGVEMKKGLDPNKPLAISMMEMKNEAKASGKPMNYAGLEILKDLDALYIHQEWEILEQISSWYEQANTYTVFDGDAKVKLFKTKEKTCCCWRICCGENRPFRMKVYDHTGKKDKAALVLTRKYRCCGWAVIPCCAHKVNVHYMVDQNNNEIGRESSRTKISSVEVPICGGCFCPTWRIKDRQGRVQANINGSTCCVNDTCGASFKVTDRNGSKMGEIRKLAPGSLKGIAMEMVTEADNFKLSFGKDIDPTIKMALLAATFQIDFTFFEDKRGVCEGRFCDIWCCGYACPCCPKALCCCCQNKDQKKTEKERRQGAPDTSEMQR